MRAKRISSLGAEAKGHPETKAKPARRTPNSNARQPGWDRREAVVDPGGRRWRVRRNKGARHDRRGRSPEEPLARDQVPASRSHRSRCGPKASGGVRPLGVPTVLDRFIQQAVMQVLQGDWDPSFSDASYGFRPGRSAHQAVERARTKSARASASWSISIGEVPMGSDILMGFQTADACSLTPRACAGPTTKGTPQGGPLSPLLSLMLDVLDKELERRGHRFVRYADDCNIYVQRVMASVTRFLARRLKLTVNTAKSAVDRPVARTFLGFSFTAGPAAKRRIAPQALARFKAPGTDALYEERQAGPSRRGVVPLRRVAGLLRLLRAIARGSDGGCAHRWKRGRDAASGSERACGAYCSSHGPWRISNSPALSYAMPNAFFARLGLASVECRPVA